MESENNYYEILGIPTDADSVEIKEAYIYKVNILHPDRLGGTSERIRRKAEAEFKLVNEAYDVLSNSEKRRIYDLKIYNRSGASEVKKHKSNDTETVTRQGVYTTKNEEKPKPEVYPTSLKITKGLPYKKQKVSFFVKNVGGHYKTLNIKSPQKWIIGIKMVSLQKPIRLPMRVDVEVMDIHWGAKYSSEIVVQLDEAEARVKIELQMEKK